MAVAVQTVGLAGFSIPMSRRRTRTVFLLRPVFSTISGVGKRSSFFSPGLRITRRLSLIGGIPRRRLSFRALTSFMPNRLANFRSERVPSC